MKTVWNESILSVVVVIYFFLLFFIVNTREMGHFPVYIEFAKMREKKKKKRSSSDVDYVETALNIKYLTHVMVFPLHVSNCASMHIVQATLPQCNLNLEGFFASYNYRFISLLYRFSVVLGCIQA